MRFSLANNKLPAPPSYNSQAMKTVLARVTLLLLLSSVVSFAQAPAWKELPLPTSKIIELPVPGEPQRTNSLPVTMALSPDGKYLALLNNGFGVKESAGRQSISVIDLASGKLTDFPDPRLGPYAAQSYFLGLAWSSDSRHLYASFGSITDPEGTKPGNTGNGIAVYRYTDGELRSERFIKIPLQTLAAGKRSSKVWDKLPDGKAIPYPAGLAVAYDRRTPGAHQEKLVVADNLSDDVLVVDPGDGENLAAHRCQHWPACARCLPLFCRDQFRWPAGMGQPMECLRDRGDASGEREGGAAHRRAQTQVGRRGRIAPDGVAAE